MRITTRVVTDIETGLVLEQDYYEYVGPVEECKGNKTDPYAQQASSISQQQLDLENQQRQFANQETARAAGNQDQAQATLSQFEGPVDQSPFYKALLTQGIESTSKAYQGAVASARSRAQQAGYGYSQPAENAAEGGIAAQGAESLAAQPGKALLGAAPMALEAAGQTASLGNSEAGAGVSSNAGASSSLAGANTSNQSAAQEQDLASKRKSGFFKTLAGVGLLAAAPFTGGATLAPGATVLGSS